MNIYEISVLENEIEWIAQENDGEIPDELLKELIEKQTESLEQIEKMAKYIRYCEIFITDCKNEELRIAERRRLAENRLKNIKKFLTPYVEERGKFTAGTIQLSVRKSSIVDVDDNFNNPEYSKQTISYKADKPKIKKAIQSGEQIKGAHLINKTNLQIK